MRPLYRYLLTTLPVVLALLLTFLAAHSPARSSIMKAWSVSQLIDRADVVLMGEVESSESRWHKGRIHTWNQVAVESVLHGQAPTSSIQVRHLGGSVREYQLTLPGGPTFNEGDHVLLFLRRDSFGEAFHVVGLSQGVFQLSPQASSNAISQRIRDGMLVGPPLSITSLTELVTEIQASAR